jgi:hypothetical protein
MELGQLPIEVQSSLQPSAPVAPGPQIPMRPAGQEDLTPPDIQSNAGIGALLTGQTPPQPAPSSFGQKLAVAATQIGIPPGPMGWAKSLVGAAVTALHNNSGNIAGAVNAVGASIGDAAAAGKDLAPGQGALAGVAKTLQARNQRQQEQQTQQFEQSEKKRVDDANIAHAQVATLLAQQTMRFADADEKRKSLTSDQAIASDLDAAGTPVLAQGLNSEEITNWRKNNPEQAKTATFIMDKLNAEKDANGNDFFRPTFKVYGSPQPVKITKENADLINKYNPQPNGDIPADSLFPGAAYVQVMKKAHLGEAMELQRQKMIADVAKDKAEAERYQQTTLNEKQRAQYGEDIAADINHYGGPGKALDGLSKINTPQAAEEARKIRAYYGEDLLEKMREADQKDREFNEREQDRKEVKLRQKQYDAAHDAYQHALSVSGNDREKARVWLSQNNPGALASLADEEQRSAVETTTTDELGNPKTSVRSKPGFFSQPIAQNQPQTIGDVIQNPAAADFQKSQDQAAQQQQAQKQGEQDRFDQRPAEKGPTVFSGFGEAPNPNWNQAEAYLQKHPEIDGPGRAAVRKQFAQSQQQVQLPKPQQQGQSMPPAVAKQYLDANGGNKDAARKAAQAAGWNF